MLISTSRLLPLAVTLLLAILGCGAPEERDLRDPSRDQYTQRLILSLKGTQAQIDALLTSEFSSCDELSGATQDALIRKICNVAKASSSEELAALSGSLSSYSAGMGRVLDEALNDISESADLVAVLESSVAAILADVSALDASVASIEALTASISGSISTSMRPIRVGADNPTAGPLYETILIQQNRELVTGWVEALGTPVAIVNNGVSATSGSTTVTITASSAHGLVAGNVVRLHDLASGRGFLRGDYARDFYVLSTPTGTTLTIALPRAATSTGTTGSNAGSLVRVDGHGLGTLWGEGDPSDVAVRVASGGSRAYNFIIRQAESAGEAEVCWDKTNRSATFATIDAAPTGGAGDITCK